MKDDIKKWGLSEQAMDEIYKLIDQSKMTRGQFDEFWREKSLEAQKSWHKEKKRIIDNW